VKCRGDGYSDGHGNNGRYAQKLGFPIVLGARAGDEKAPTPTLGPKQSNPPGTFALRVTEAEEVIICAAGTRPLLDKEKGRACGRYAPLSAAVGPQFGSPTSNVNGVGCFHCDRDAVGDITITLVGSFSQ